MVNSPAQVNDHAQHAPRPAARSGCGRLALIVASIALVAVLAIIGVRLSTGAGGAGGTGAASPGILTRGQDVTTEVRPAPGFRLDLFSGEALDLGELQGRPVVLNFWATWCPPCREEAPVLEKAWQEYRDQGVVFVGVDIWDTERDAEQFLDRYGITYPNGQDPRGSIAVDYGVYGIPETFFIDASGRIVRRWNGPLTESQLRSFLAEIVETPSDTSA